MRAAHADVAVSVGPLVNFTCDLITPTVSASSKAGKAAGKVETKLSCPTCHEKGETSLVNQRYICQNRPEHGPFEQGELTKAVVAGDGVAHTVGTAAEVDAIRKDSSLPDKQLNLSAHPADEVLAKTLPGEGCWIVRPKKDGDPAYQLLLAMATESGRIDLGDTSSVLIGPVVLSKKQKVVQVQRWGNHLVFRELLLPSALKEGLEAEAVPVDPRLPEMGRKLLTTYTVDFEADVYEDGSNDRLRELLGRLHGDVVVAMPDSVGVTQEATVDDLMAALEAVVAAA